MEYHGVVIYFFNGVNASIIYKLADLKTGLTAPNDVVGGDLIALAVSYVVIYLHLIGLIVNLLITLCHPGDALFYWRAVIWLEEEFPV